MEIQIEETIKWFQKTNAKLQANKAYLTDLDQAIGDGDHGINMARGFNEVINKINDTDEYASVSDVVKDVAMTVISKVGGAAGPLYGTDRKSTRLNSSHVAISYAVFCLQKKT